MTTNSSNDANYLAIRIRAIREIRSAELVVDELTCLRVNKLIVAINRS